MTARTAIRAEARRRRLRRDLDALTLERMGIRNDAGGNTKRLRRNPLMVLTSPCPTCRRFGCQELHASA